MIGCDVEGYPSTSCPTTTSIGWKVLRYPYISLATTRAGWKRVPLYHLTDDDNERMGGRLLPSSSSLRTTVIGWEVHGVLPFYILSNGRSDRMKGRGVPIYLLSNDHSDRMRGIWVSLYPFSDEHSDRMRGSPFHIVRRPQLSNVRERCTSLPTFRRPQ